MPIKVKEKKKKEEAKKIIKKPNSYKANLTALEGNI